MTKRIFVDSRHRSVGTDSDFQISLPMPVPVGREAKALIDYVSFPNVSKTIVAGQNDILFLKEMVDGQETNRYTTLSEGNYDGFSLAAEVKSKLGTGYTATFDSSNMALVVTNSAQQFKLLIPYESSFWGATLSVRNASQAIGLSVQKPFATIWSSDTIPQLMPLHTVFMHSTMGRPQALSATGATDVIRRITIQVPYGHRQVDVQSTPLDLIDIGGEELSTLSFSFRDAFGFVVPTHGLPITFSILILNNEDL